MSSEESRRTREGGSLENIREASDAVEKSTAQIAIEKTIDRWQIVLSIVVLGVASGLLYYVDGGLSIDAIVFAALAGGLGLYFLATLRTDVRME